MNSLNIITCLKTTPVTDVVIGMNINSTRYFSGKTYNHTCLLRLKWVRRKHINSWLFFINVLSLWSSEYNYYRSYNNFIWNRNFFKFNFLLFNFLLLKYLPASTDKMTENVLTASVYPKLLTFFSNKTHAKFHI